ncbi:hypothetical protein TIFTF001_025569 [Ficus carica]|uniref:Uncharacterized protein n=1 Tax=Ficus carica TaxID=3494 RepID=A0AA88B1F9_FICCA|nr:hypothetical protein TIFTF001_025569 [Ficus carica]
MGEFPMVMRVWGGRWARREARGVAIREPLSQLPYPAQATQCQNHDLYYHRLEHKLANAVTQVATSDLQPRPAGNPNVHRSPCAIVSPFLHREPILPLLLLRATSIVRVLSVKPPPHCSLFCSKKGKRPPFGKLVGDEIFKLELVDFSKINYNFS